MYICNPLAGVVELVDTPDLGSGAARRGGSIPFTRTEAVNFHCFFTFSTYLSTIYCVIGFKGFPVAGWFPGELKNSTFPFVLLYQILGFPYSKNSVSSSTSIFLKVFIKFSSSGNDG